MSSGLLITGAVCSAVFKQNDLYFFFDSHSMDKMDFHIDELENLHADRTTVCFEP